MYQALENEHMPSSCLSVRQRTYRGPYPKYPNHIAAWRYTLAAAYAEHSLIDGHICPHQGTDLAGIITDRDGAITCPLHGLRWHARTGAALTP